MWKLRVIYQGLSIGCYRTKEASFFQEASLLWYVNMKTCSHTKRTLFAFFPSTWDLGSSGKYVWIIPYLAVLIPLYQDFLGSEPPTSMLKLLNLQNYKQHKSFTKTVRNILLKNKPKKVNWSHWSLILLHHVRSSFFNEWQISDKWHGFLCVTPSSWSLRISVG